MQGQASHLRHPSRGVMRMAGGMGYVLHYAPDNASIIIRIVLDELSCAYEARLVDRGQKAQESDGYRRSVPTGLIPALDIGDTTLFETGAILLWLSETHERMAPAPGTPERATFLKWFFFLSNTLHPLLRLNFYPDKYVGPGLEDQSTLRTTIRAAHPVNTTLPRALLLLDAELARRGAGDTPDIFEIYLAACVRWCGLYPLGQTDWFDLPKYPALHSLALRLETRPSALRVALAEGLGETIFSKPQKPQPPEGSAL